ncbi:HD domain-containing phosphohydrolase [Lutispora thermophila]|uniref:HDIG domain-containing protein n=1 Tax=Lutispora thermophila DSM 19022 TaxID=1122184 RepID=A0A1M6BZQ4_9FIRM|nr:HD domain-containing phosphohydrolase [Lutispora thermophila]SHI54091.1 HDIG domain-containing protein [Lutispora thermophila DSM 19022]
MMKIGIRGKIILAMLAIIIISVATIGVLSYNNAKTIVMNEIKQSNFKTLQNANDYFLRKFMADMEYVVDHWAQDEEIVNYKNMPGQPKMVTSIPDHFRNISNQWMGYAKSSPYIAWIYFASEEDGSIFITPIDPTMPEDYDCRTRDWYKKAVESGGRTVWTDPYQDAGESEEIVVTVARAVKRDGNLVGVVGMDIKLSRFSDIINDIIYDDEGYLMLINSQGYIFSHPDKGMLMANINDDQELKAQLISENGTNIFRYKGRESIISYMTVPETGWMLIGLLPLDLDKELSPIRNRAIQVALTSIVVTFYIGFQISRVITRPLKNIMDVIGSISQGELDKHIVIGSKDEFKVLGDQFNNMMDTVKQLIDERNLHVQELTKMNKELRNSYLSTVLSLANAIEANDKYTRGHCERVSCLSTDIARKMGLGDNELHVLEFASILHDIGKIGVPSDILNKEGKLTSDEFEMIRKHPIIGYEILAHVDFLSESRNVLLQHHERVDGKGYPKGLKGEEISLLAKIISVADAYDAMTNSRPYRKTPLTKEQAIEEMKKGKGSQFDEVVVDILIDLLT